MPPDGESLREMARQAMEKARLFTQGAGDDLGQQLQEMGPGIVDDAKRIFGPPKLPETGPEAIMGGMPFQLKFPAAVLGRLPQVEQTISSGLGRAGVSGGKESGLYLPDSPLGEISIGPREALGFAAGMALPTGPLGKGSKVSKIGADAEARILRVYKTEGARRLARDAEERKLAKLAKAETAAKPELPAKRPFVRGSAPPDPTGKPAITRTGSDVHVGAGLDDAALMDELYGAEPPNVPRETIYEQKVRLAKEANEAGLDTSSVMLDGDGQPTQMPAGRELEPGAVLRDSGSENSPSSSGNLLTRFAGPTRFAKPNTTATGIEQAIDQIGAPRRGNKRPAPMTREAEIANERMDARAQKFFDEELRDAGDDPVQSSTMKNLLRSKIYGTEEPKDMFKKRLKKKDGTDADLIPPYWKRIEQQYQRNRGTLRTKQTEVPIPKSIATDKNWAWTPEGYKFLEAELWADLLGGNSRRFAGKEKADYAVSRMRDTARSMANAADADNPLSVRRKEAKPAKYADTEQAYEGTTSDGELLAEHRSLGSSDTAHFSQGDLEASGVGERMDDRGGVPRSLDENTLGDQVGRAGLDFPDDKTAREFYELKRQISQDEKILDANRPGGSMAGLDPGEQHSQALDAQYRIDKANDRIAEIFDISGWGDDVERAGMDQPSRGNVALIDPRSNLDRRPNTQVPAGVSLDRYNGDPKEFAKTRAKYAGEAQTFTGPTEAPSLGRQTQGRTPFETRSPDPEAYKATVEEIRSLTKAGQEVPDDLIDQLLELGPWGPDAVESGGARLDPGAKAQAIARHDQSVLAGEHHGQARDLASERPGTKDFRRRTESVDPNFTPAPELADERAAWEAKRKAETAPKPETKKADPTPAELLVAKMQEVMGNPRPQAEKAARPAPQRATRAAPDEWLELLRAMRNPTGQHSAAPPRPASAFQRYAESKLRAA